MKKIDWSTYKFRASQTSKLLVGKIEFVEEIDEQIKELINKRDVLVHENKRLKWTETNESDLKKLIEKKKTPIFKRLPKTMTNELRKIHRSETFERDFSFTNKYVEKGNMEEENAISLYQSYRKKVLGEKNTFFLNNKKRVSNEWISGEVDLTDTNDVENCNEGFDIKCSWELDTFPYPEDDLGTIYEAQNQSYMWLTGAEKWTTAYCLVNTNEHLLHREKEKWRYTLGYHKIDATMSDKQREKIEKLVSDKMRELEIRYIYDYDKFTNDNSGHLLEISRGEWYEKGYDIPLKSRIVEKVSTRNESLIEDLKERIKISREYLSFLDSL